MESKLVLKGTWEIRLIDKKTGKIKSVDKGSNLIVNTGLERVARRLFGNTYDPFVAIAIGEGATAPAVGNISLENEVKRVGITPIYEASYKGIWEYTFTFLSGESYAITEAGLFDSAVESGSTMLDRFTFSVKNVDSDTDLYVKVKITIA